MYPCFVQFLRHPHRHRAPTSLSLRLASCCKVQVVKGGAGLRICERSLTSATRQSPPTSRSRSVAACSLSSSSTFLPLAILPVVSSKSLPLATRTPPTDCSVACKTAFHIRQWRENRPQIPIFAGFEGAPLFLTLHQQPHCHRLHAACR